ncbi:MAG TPA: glycosyltransferase, partial [Gemmatales bacterium]|nr:glycosyltransferase [Gemmatales bacterium]
MKVALFSRNLHRGDAIGQQTLAKWSYFQKQSSEVRLYLSEASDITSAWVGTARQLWQDAAEQQFLLQADLILAEFGAAYDLLHLLPAIRLAADGVHRPVIVVEYHGVTPRELAEAEAQAELLQAEAQRCYLWSADGILVHSSFAARELNRETGIPLERIHTIPCWVAPPFEITEQRAKRTSAKVDLRTPPQSIAADSRIILFVGRFTRNKQPALLVEALRLSQHRNWQLVFIGSQDDIYRSYREACQQQVARAGLQERVHFLGKVRESELAHWYRLADCIALPSRHECFGMPMVEAMQYGKPVLYGDAGALPEVVGHAGLQCSTHSAQAWTSAWHRLFEPVSVAET